MNDLLDMSKLQAGEFSIERSPVDVQQLFEETTDLLRPEAVAKGLLLSIGPSSLVPCYFDIDAARLQQVMYNLVGNTIKFTERGSVAITLRAVLRADGRHELRC